MLKQRALAELQIRDRLRIQNERTVVRDFCVGITGDRSKVLLDRLRSSLDLEKQDSLAFGGRVASIEVGPGRPVFLGELLVGDGQFVTDVVFLRTKNLAGFPQPQFQILNLSPRRSQTERHLKDGSGRPAGVIVVCDRPGITAERIPVILDQVVSEPVDLIRGDEIEPWPDEAFCSQKLQFETFDVPLVPPNFDAMSQSLGNAHRPVRLEGCGHRLVGRAQNLAIVDGQTNQTSQRRFAFVKLRQSFFGEHLRLEVSVTGDRFVFDSKTRRTALIELRFRVAPGFSGTLSRFDLRIVNPVLQIEIPVGVFDILQQVDHVLFKIGQRDVVVDSRDDNSLIHS